MAVSRTVWWVAGGLLARLLMIAVLLMSVRFIFANYTNNTYRDNFNQLESYKYAVASGIMGLAGTLLQVPVAIYLLCKSSKMTASALLLDISMHADMVITTVLASGVGAGFGATNDALRYVREFYRDDRYSGDRSDLVAYYNRGNVAVAFLLVGMVLSMCATVVSARLRSRANDHAQT